MAKKQENSEERRFTLRLSEVESQSIEELRTILRENTDSAVVRKVIVNYKTLHDNYEREKQKNERLEREKRILQEKVDAFLSAFNNLKCG